MDKYLLMATHDWLTTRKDKTVNCFIHLKGVNEESLKNLNKKGINIDSELRSIVTVKDIRISLLSELSDLDYIIHIELSQKLDFQSLWLPKKK